TGGAAMTAPEEPAAAPAPQVRPDLLLPHDIHKADAVSLLANRLGIPIGNPWQSGTVGGDIRRISTELGTLANSDIRFAPHGGISAVQQSAVYSTPPRPFPPPRFANTRHAAFADFPPENYVVGPSD